MHMNIYSFKHMCGQLIAVNQQYGSE